MRINLIRKTFLDFFAEKGHKIVPSAPMVIKNDPTLMFTNAGMNQFKDYFLGINTATEKRVADTQKCLRVSGKHNDLEEVGVDTYHHTMFEMLGNWSFGDYFKKEAIEWAWELLSEVYKIDKDRIYVTVFKGDRADKVEADSEAFDIWEKLVGKDRILLCDKKDNFWEMGDTGPCGPCSEIHVDIRNADERKRVKGKSLVNTGHPQVIEIWNNVFIQFNRKANGELEALPNKHVDTGMGLERLAMVLQGVQSNYDTDLFQTLIAQTERISGKKYGEEEKQDIAFRVIADHIRAISFSIADGQLPSNTGAGYVIRRILRRAVRYGYQYLGFKESFLAGLVSALSEEMSDAFPELNIQRDLIEKVIREEELAFFRTLENGIKQMDTLITAAKKSGDKKLNGLAVFELYDTFGFPIDLTTLIARENDLGVDEEGFNAELQKQKVRSRAAGQIETDDWVLINDEQTVTFVGYDELESPCFISKYRKFRQKGKEMLQIVLDRTPFYAEGGGEVGDSGWLRSASEEIEVLDTRKENNLIVHFVNNLPSDLRQKFVAVVNAGRRAMIQANHSVTHLLHHHLRAVLGTHVSQKGSLVHPDYLRFDFSHFAKVSDEELVRIETLVNADITANIPLHERRQIPMKEATALGAMALFGEKYGDSVRVIQFGKSLELCGGCHVKSTGAIGSFKIISEGSVAAGIRRIEAISSVKAGEYSRGRMTQFEEISALLNNPKDLKAAVQELLERNSALNKQVENLNREKSKQLGKEIQSAVVLKGDINFVSAILDLDADGIKDICFQLRSEVENVFAVIGGKSGGKASLSIIISDSLLSRQGFHAGNLVRESAKLIQGGGGGQPFFATAGGKDASGLSAAIDKVLELTSLK